MCPLSRLLARRAGALEPLAGTARTEEAGSVKSGGSIRSSVAAHGVLAVGRPLSPEAGGRGFPRTVPRRGGALDTHCARAKRWPARKIYTRWPACGRRPPLLSAGQRRGGGRAGLRPFLPALLSASLCREGAGEGATPMLLARVARFACFVQDASGDSLRDESGACSPRAAVCIRSSARKVLTSAVRPEGPGGRAERAGEGLALPAVARLGPQARALLRSLDRQSLCAPLRESERAPQMPSIHIHTEPATGNE